MENKAGDPAAIRRNPILIKAAQEELGLMDILICGRCHSSFIFIEEFIKHKENCKFVATFKCEAKFPEVWAFLLWKGAVLTKVDENAAERTGNSWQIYQQWITLPQEVRDAWIEAGKSLQRYKKLSKAQMQAVHDTSTYPQDMNTGLNVKAGAGKRKLAGDDISKTRKLIRVKKNTKTFSKDASAKDEIHPLHSENMKTYGPKKDVGMASGQSGQKDITISKVTSQAKDDKAHLSKDSSQEQTDPCMEEITDEIHIKEEQLSDANNDEECIKEPLPVATMQPKPTAKRTSIGSSHSLLKDGSNISSEEEYVVEKILAKRFNPRKKYYEYLLKWEGYPHDQNTWEPVHNMAACDELVEIFERNLARQKLNQQQQQKELQQTHPNSKVVTKVVKNTPKSVAFHFDDEPGPSGMQSRPVRSSKKKALAQVKSWCGSMAKRSEIETGKRKGTESDSEDDVAAKHIKYSSLDDDWTSGDDMSCASSIDGDSAAMLTAKPKEPITGQIVKRPIGRPRKHPIVNPVNGLNTPKLKTIIEDTSDSANLEPPDGDISTEGLGSIVSTIAKHRSADSSPPPVLVANSKGVIKVDPSQVPKLTSGVYIIGDKNGNQSTKEKIYTVSTSQSPEKSTILIPQSPSARKSFSPTSLKVGQSMTVKSQNKPDLPFKPNSGLAHGLVKLLPKQMKPGIRAPPPLNKSALGGVRPVGQQKNISPRSGISVLSNRPGLPQGRGQTPRMSPTVRPVNVSGTPLKKSPGNYSPVTTKIMSAVRPRMPNQMVKGMATQGKGIVRPIQAILGKPIITEISSGSTVKKYYVEPDNLISDSQDILTPGRHVVDFDKPRKIGRGRGRAGDSSISDSDPGKGKQRDSKLIDSDGVHMEFHEITSSESDDDYLPDFPSLENLPPIEPESPPRPFTLCPITGKVLSRAEGEPTPPPSPEPTPASENVSVVAPSNLEEKLPDLSDQDDKSAPFSAKLDTDDMTISGNASDSGSLGTLRTEEGLTVTKIPESTASSLPQLSTSSITTSNVKGSSSISVPATKLFIGGDDSKIGTEIVTVTGEDGIVYQISTEGQELEGGEELQQCVYVTDTSSDATVLTVDAAVAEAVAQLIPEPNVIESTGCSQFFIKESEDGSSSQQLVMTSAIDEISGQAGESSVLAHVIDGTGVVQESGKRRVVLLLPDGNLMMTDVDEEQFASLNPEEDVDQPKEK